MPLQWRSIIKTILFANGAIEDYALIRPYTISYDLLAACDGGARHTKAMGLTPDIVFGDLDSLPPDLLEELRRQNVAFQIYSTQKDASDLELALRWIRAKAADAPCTVDILGGLGGRFDHSLINCHVLWQALRLGIEARLLDGHCVIRLTDRNISLLGRTGDIVSLIPLTTEVSGIQTEGLQYPLCGETLRVGGSRGLSNVMTAPQAAVHLETGLLLVIQNASP
jgi:thiamine pyrophosphokinase